MESRGGIYKQTICECLLQKRVCLRPSESARSCHQENATSLFPAVCSSSPEVLQTLSSWFCSLGFVFPFVPPTPAPFWVISVLPLARKGEKGILPQGGFHGQRGGSR